MNMQLSDRILTLMVLLCIPASGTMMTSLSLQELSVGSEKVVQAKVTALVPQWNSDSSCIYTYVRMNVLDDILDPAGDNEIIIKQPGGRIGTKALVVSGTSEFKVGEEDVLFLFRDEKNPATFRAMGMCQGKFQVYRDGANVARVYQDTSAARVLGKSSASMVTPSGTAYLLDDFKKLIVQLRADSTITR